MSLLLLFAGASSGASITPIAHGKVLAILAADEVPVGEVATIYAELIDHTGNFTPDVAPQFSVWAVSAAGVRSAELALVNMTQVGSTNVYSATWTPSASDTYEMLLAGTFSTVTYAVTRAITARPRFDSIAFALDEVLVSRM